MNPIVTGYGRSGTSAMMGALIAGGWDAVYTPDRDTELNASEHNVYLGNKHYYEAADATVDEFAFPRGHPNKAIKSLTVYGIRRLAPMRDGYKVILMWRHPEEIRQSYVAMKRTRPNEVPPVWLDHGPDQMANYEAHMDLIVDHINNRADMDYIKVRYREELLADPHGTMERIKWGLGIELDVDRAAASIDTTQCRAKLEALTVGI